MAFYSFVFDIIDIFIFHLNNLSVSWSLESAWHCFALPALVVFTTYIWNKYLILIDKWDEKENIYLKETSFYLGDTDEYPFPLVCPIRSPAESPSSKYIEAGVCAADREPLLATGMRWLRTIDTFASPTIPVLTSSASNLLYFICPFKDDFY